MTNIRDIQSEDDMVAFRASDKSVVLMTPAWSIYPKKSLRTLQSILPELATRGIQSFTVTEDDPAKNQSFFDWLTEHDLGQLGLVTTGSGGLIVCRRGKPIHFEVVTSHMAAEELNAVIFNASEE